MKNVEQLSILDIMKTYSTFTVYMGLALMVMVVDFAFNPDTHTTFRLVLQIMVVSFLVLAFLTMALSDVEGKRKYAQVIIHIGMSLFMFKMLFLADETGPVAGYLHVLSNLCIIAALITNRMPFKKK